MSINGWRKAEMVSDDLHKMEAHSEHKQENKAQSLSPDGKKRGDMADYPNLKPWPIKTYLSSLPKEEARKIQAMGGAATKGISKKPYTKCINCDIRFTCRRAFEEAETSKYRNKENARCVYELESRHGDKDKQLQEFKAFIGGDPRDLLTKIQTLFNKLEGMVDAEPSYTKQTNLLYLMMNIYRLKFGEKAFVMNVNADISNNPSLDIKGLMKELREKEIEATMLPTEDAEHLDMEDEPEQELDDTTTEHTDEPTTPTTASAEKKSSADNEGGGDVA